MVASSTPPPRGTSSPRRTSSTSNAAAPPPGSSIVRGATARSAVSQKVNASINGVSRRSSVRHSVSSVGAAEVDGVKEELIAALKRETDEKEELLVRIGNKEQTISELSTENDSLNASLNAAETRISELYTDQARMEEEASSRLDLVDMLRTQVLELERDNRDVIRRYNEQTSTFDAERQSSFDNEQHLKSRIQSLIQARKNSDAQKQEEIQKREELVETHSIAESISEGPENDESEVTPVATNSNSDFSRDDDDDEPAEMTALRLELSTLSTSYASLQNTVQHLTSQLLDLRRVNKAVQEENESYKILLTEKTLSGQFDISRAVATKESDEGSDSESDDVADEDLFDTNDQNSVLSGDRATLDPVDELPEDMDMELSQMDDGEGDGETSSVASRDHDRSRRQGRGGRRIPKTSRSPAPHKGESLANLPISGPGLDLAAELGRAENQAILGSTTDKIDSKDRSVVNGTAKVKRPRRSTTATASLDAAKQDGTLPAGEVDALRNEVKSLKDANKALSLYASKIIDRIVLTGGFEHVLAVDYDKSAPSSPVKAKTQSPKKTVPESPSPQKKPRPQSTIFARNVTAEPEASERLVASPSSAATSPPLPPADQTSREKRRSMSFDWRSLTMFGTAEKKPETNPHLRPLTLRPGASIVGARKLDTHEDEEDKRERERMHATLKLMGIDKPQTPSTPSELIKSPPSDADSSQSQEVTSPKPQSSRFSFFRSRSSTSDAASVDSGKSGNSTPNLTHEALERAEAQTSIAALDEREKVLSVEISKGSNGGFTEIPRRQRGEGRSKRSKRSGESGSGSTVWSAGMSTHKETDSEDDGRRSIMAGSQT